MSQLQPTSTAGVPRLIATQNLHESPFNPRKRFNQKSLDELADDIATQGIVSPILVRPRPLQMLEPAADGVLDAAPEFEEFEIVFGHRRYRAALIAALPVVPCLVREMTDQEVMRAQISENLSREDVHAIEEAEGFQALLDGDATLTADKLAENYGRSRSYVYGRLKLLQASSEVREACLNGEYGADVALLIARLRTDPLQSKALEYIRKDYRSSLTDGGKQSFRSIRNLLNEKFALDLKGAMFDTSDALLVPAAGTCGDCPKRTGNAPEFIDIAEPSTKRDRYGQLVDYMPHKGPDVCTDPDCFDLKKAMHLKNRGAALAAEGKTVVEGNKARGALDASGNVKGAFVALKDVKDLLKKTKPGAKVETVTILDPRTDKTVQAVRRADLAAAGVKLQEPKPKKAGYDWEAERRERAARAPKETEERMALLKRVHEAARASSRSLEDLQLILDKLLDGVEGVDRDTLAALWGHERFEALREATATMTPHDLALLMLDAVIVDNTTSLGYDDEYYHPRALYKAAKHHVLEAASTPSTAARVAKGAKAKADDETAKLENGSATAVDVDVDATATPSNAARAAKGAKGKADKKAPSVSLGALMRAGENEKGVDLVGDPIVDEQTVEAGSAGDEAKDEPADAGVARDPNTSDMFPGAQA